MNEEEGVTVEEKADEETEAPKKGSRWAGSGVKEKINYLNIRIPPETAVKLQELMDFEFKKTRTEVVLKAIDSLYKRLITEPV